MEVSPNSRKRKRTEYVGEVIDLESDSDEQVVPSGSGQHDRSKARRRGNETARRAAVRVDKGKGREVETGPAEAEVVQSVAPLSIQKRHQPVVTLSSSPAPLPEPQPSSSSDDAPPAPPAQAPLVLPAATNGAGSSHQTAEERIKAEIDTMVAQVLEIMSDVQPDYVLQLCKQLYDHPQHQGNVCNVVVQFLLEKPDYPKVEAAASTSAAAAAATTPGEAAEPLFDYSIKDRLKPRGALYNKLTAAYLTMEFPFIPAEHIRERLRANHNLCAPAFLDLYDQDRLETPPFTRKRTARKSKAKALNEYVGDEDYEKEVAWIEKWKAERKEEESRAEAKRLAEEELAASGAGIECGCCFDQFHFEELIQCPDAHLFCKDCTRRFAEEVIGRRGMVRFDLYMCSKAMSSYNCTKALKCMAQEGCMEEFSASEVQRFLPPKQFHLWEQIKQEKAIAEAKIEGLESCPFCPYSVVFENDEEKLFRCENATCKAVTCRKCKKKDHLPKSCEECKEDSALTARHVIEEAMTAALTRKCPKAGCGQSFVKTDGCNKMRCPSCQTLSCYVCRKVINGYEHFAPVDGYLHPEACNLHDPIEKRGNDEVAKAAREALEKYRAENPEAVDANIDIEALLPAASDHGGPLMNIAAAPLGAARAIFNRIVGAPAQPAPPVAVAAGAEGDGARLRALEAAAQQEIMQRHHQLVEHNAARARHQAHRAEREHVQRQLRARTMLGREGQAGARQQPNVPGAAAEAQPRGRERLNPALNAAPAQPAQPGPQIHPNPHVNRALQEIAELEARLENPNLPPQARNQYTQLLRHWQMQATHVAAHQGFGHAGPVQAAPMMAGGPAFFQGGQPMHHVVANMAAPPGWPAGMPPPQMHAPAPAPAPGGGYGWGWW